MSGFLCSADENGVWRAKARLTNVGAAANTYTVRFSVIRTGSQEVLGMKEESFTVAPGDSTDVALASIYTSNSEGLECVARVTAVPAAQSDPPARVPQRQLTPKAAASEDRRSSAMGDAGSMPPRGAKREE